MAGLAIPLNATITGAGFPILRQDEILSDGSLMLLDASHYYGGFGSGVPVDNQTFENIAWKEAAALMSSDQAGVRAWFDYYGGTGFTRERTGKGGLHFILSQAGDLGASVGAEIMMPTALRTYLAAHPSHAYYISTWTRLTKVAQNVVSGVTYKPATMTIQSTASSTSNYLGYFDKDDNSPLAASAKRLGSVQSNGANTLGNSFRAIAVDGWTGTLPSVASDIRQGMVIAGARGAYGGLAASAGAPSFALYRLYIEDMTVSGRDYAEVEAIDLAAYTREFAAGGKFYGDTFTTPA